MNQREQDTTALVLISGVLLLIAIVAGLIWSDKIVFEPRKPAAREAVKE